MAEILGPGSWNVDMEVNLFHAMRGHKPVGVNRHFQMVFIHEKLNNASGKKIPSKNIWEHLSSMYDLQALNESEILPFPNKPLDFQLSTSEFQEIIEREYPRMQNSQAQSAAEEAKAKPEGQAKGGKSSKSDAKPSSITKPDSKPSATSPADTKPSQSGQSGSASADGKSSGIAKLEGKAVITPSNKGEVKNIGKLVQSSGATAASFAPEPSPKRTKRTRTNMSASNSPVTPEVPPSKRRR